MRLDAAPQTAPVARAPLSGVMRCCQECGGALARPAAPSGQRVDFCCAACRKAFHNRRMKRGAELYDLFMAIRFDRSAATALKLWRIINRLASRFRAEDARQRAGRLSWTPPAEILARNPSLKAEIVFDPNRDRKSVETHG